MTVLAQIKGKLTDAIREQEGRYAGGRGAQKTIGELVTCPFCTSVWVATGFTAGMIFLPRATRLAMGRTTHPTSKRGGPGAQTAHEDLSQQANTA